MKNISKNTFIIAVSSLVIGLIVGWLLFSTSEKKSAEIHDLRLAFEETTGEDLNWFFNQWFLGKGHPVIFTEQEINQEQQTVTIRIQQAQSFNVFKLPKYVQTRLAWTTPQSILATLKA